MIFAATFVIVFMTVFGAIMVARREVRPRETPRQREADRLLTELWIIEQLLPGLPAEFKSKLSKYINHEKEVNK